MKGTMNKIVSLALAIALCFSMVAMIGTSASAAEYTASTTVPTTLNSYQGVKLNTVTYTLKTDAEGKVVTDTEGNAETEMTFKNYTPTDANSNPVPVFIIDGTTYLPLRAVSKLFGAAIEWDNDLRIVKVQTSGANSTATDAYSSATASTSGTMPTTPDELKAQANVKIYVDGALKSDISAFIADAYGTTYIALRKITEIFKGDIIYNAPKNEASYDSKYPAYSVCLFGAIPAYTAGEADELEDETNKPADISSYAKSILNSLITKSIVTAQNMIDFLADAKTNGLATALNNLLKKTISTSFIGDWLKANPEMAAKLETILGISDAKELAQAIREYINDMMDDTHSIFDPIAEGLGDTALRQISALINLLPLSDAQKTAILSYLNGLNLNNTTLSGIVERLIAALAPAGGDNNNNNEETIIDKVVDVVDKITISPSEVIDYLRNCLPTAMMTGLTQKFLAGEIKGISDLINAITEILAGMEDNTLIGKVNEFLASKGIDPTNSNIMDIFGTGTISGAITAIRTGLQNAFNNTGILGDMFNKLKDTIGNIIPSIGDNDNDNEEDLPIEEKPATNPLEAIKDMLTGKLGDKFGTGIISGIMDTIKTAIGSCKLPESKALSFAQAIAEAMLENFGRPIATATALKNVFTDAMGMGSCSGLLSNFMNGISSVFGGGLSGILGGLFN